MNDDIDKAYKNINMVIDSADTYSGAASELYQKFAELCTDYKSLYVLYMDSRYEKLELYAMAKTLSALASASKYILYMRALVYNRSVYLEYKGRAKNSKINVYSRRLEVISIHKLKIEKAVSTVLSGYSSMAMAQKKPTTIDKLKDMAIKFIFGDNKYTF